MSDKKLFRPDDTLENADWAKGHGPQDLGISTRAQLVAYLSRNHITLRQFAKLPVFYQQGRVDADPAHVGPLVIVRHLRRGGPLG